MLGSLLILEAMNTKPELTFRDVQFSILNSNFILVLTSDARLFVVNVLKDTRLEFSEQTLDLVPQTSPYKAPPHPIDFISFSQASSAEDLGLTPFQVFLLSKTGDIYTICPLLLSEMLFTSEAFELMMLKLSDSAP
jgi:hypothetical protein